MAEATTCAEVPSTGSCSGEAPAGCYDEEASWREARAYLVADVIPVAEVPSTGSGSCRAPAECYDEEASALAAYLTADVIPVIEDATSRHWQPHGSAWGQRVLHLTGAAGGKCAAACWCKKRSAACARGKLCPTFTRRAAAARAAGGSDL